MQFTLLAALTGLAASAQAAAIGNVSEMANASKMTNTTMAGMIPRAVNVSEIVNASRMANTSMTVMNPRAVNITTRAVNITDRAVNITDRANVTAPNARRAVNVSAVANGTDGKPMSSTAVVTNIKKITSVSSSANKICSSLSFTSIPFDAPTLAKDLQQIVSLATGDVSAMHSSGVGTFSTAEQQPICRAFINFVHVHQALLRTIIGKHGLLADTPFTAPVAAGLRGIEGIVDTLAFGIIGAVPSCHAQATKAKMQLDKTLKSAVATYA